jgi:hypothetical protein
VHPRDTASSAPPHGRPAPGTALARGALATLLGLLCVLGVPGPDHRATQPPAAAAAPLPTASGPHPAATDRVTDDTCAATRAAPPRVARESAGDRAAEPHQPVTAAPRAALTTHRHMLRTWPFLHSPPCLHSSRCHPGRAPPASPGI